ncbi:hypothetical protein FQZ97_1059680 [compost metagenome]
MLLLELLRLGRVLLIQLLEQLAALPVMLKRGLHNAVLLSGGQRQWWAFLDHGLSRLMAGRSPPIGLCRWLVRLLPQLG